MAAANASAIPGFDSALLTRAESKQLLAALPEPKAFWGYLLMCLETPRPSEDLDRIRAKIAAIGKAHGLDVATDKIGNIRLRKAASDAKYAAAPKVCIQSHLDVVTTATDAKHDFHSMPVHAFVDGDFLKAKGTTLGADDGAGVAAALALLTAPGQKHGPLEAVFTADEETTMAGAEFMDTAPFLQSTVLLNVDSEEEHSICVGCAGGFEQLLKLPVQRVAAAEWSASAAQYTLVTAELDHLLGGHSGIDIHRGLANALHVLARIVSYASHAVAPAAARLLSFKGGNAANAIPHEATAQVLVRTDALAAFRAAVDAHFTALKEEFKVVEQPLEKDKKKDEKDKEKAAGTVVLKPLAWTLKVTAAPATAATPAPLTAAATLRAVDLMLSVPHGVLRMSAEVKGKPDTSINFAFATLHPTPQKAAAAAAADAKAQSAVGAGAAAAETDVLTLHFFARSSFDSQMIETNRKLNALARLSGCETAERFNYFPGWQPDVTSVALAHTKRAHAALFPGAKPPKVYAVHAGLECGLIQGRYPGIDCVSIGPTIHGAHTPDERLKISSVKPFYDWLKATVESLADAKADTK